MTQLLPRAFSRAVEDFNLASLEFPFQRVRPVDHRNGLVGENPAAVELWAMRVVRLVLRAQLELGSSPRRAIARPEDATHPAGLGSLLRVPKAAQVIKLGPVNIGVKLRARQRLPLRLHAPAL